MFGVSQQLPTITVDDVALAPSRKRRLETDSHVYASTPKYRQHSKVDDKVEFPDTEADSSQYEQTEVCFGMLQDRAVCYAQVSTLSPRDQADQNDVVFFPPNVLRRRAAETIVGHLNRQDGEVLSRLEADSELRTQLRLDPKPLGDGQVQDSAGKDIGFLGIIIYGMKERLTDVDAFISQCGYYLDDPIGCDANVPYVNPQCLSTLYEQPIMTFELDKSEQDVIEELVTSSSDVLAGFETTDRFAEAPMPRAIRTTLQTHQLQALTFLHKRETGLHPTEDGWGLWIRRSSAHGDCFFNLLTGEERSFPDCIWRGGLLADDMGLGKTLTMLALVASDKEMMGMKLKSCLPSSRSNFIDSTLIVVPLNLIAVWETQLRTHVYNGQVTWFVHHAKNKFVVTDAALAPNIVFTTYQTIESQFRSTKAKGSSLFEYEWKRIVLDEAHIVRNHDTSTARAITSLKATCRWAISGTPIQNNLTDFLGLFSFLQFAPYDNPKTFDDQISNLWRNNSTEDATGIFKKFLSCIMIRRTKAILDLPPKLDKIVRLSFDDEEEQYYRLIEQPVVEMLDRETADKTNGTDQRWTNAIQQINKLRLVCVLGTSGPSHQSRTNSLATDVKLAMLSARASTGGDQCGQCLQPIDSPLTSETLEPSNTTRIYYSDCEKFFCAACAVMLHYEAPKSCGCVSKGSSCLLRPLSSGLSTPRLTPAGSVSPSAMDIDNFPRVSSKVRTLVSHIKAHHGEKHIVFSMWTTALDMVERGLGDDVRFVRIDGSVTKKKRDHAIQLLHNDPRVRVILLTISCGACGLDLTAASQVHLLEPQWNPSVEDQALARAHRLGQTRPVTTYRYIIRDSFEEHILKVQDRKKLLATTLLSNSSSLQVLRSLLHGDNDSTSDTV